MIELLNTLLNIKQDDPKQICPLVEQCSKIALTILHKRNESDINVFNHHGLTLKDLAVDAIIPLFIRTNPNSDIPIKRSLINWDREINSDAEAHFFLFQIIGNRIEQEIAKKLKEADPFFAKILRSISHLVESGRLNKISWFGVAYITEKGKDKITQKPVDSEFIDSLPGKLFSDSNEKTIYQIFELIKKETDYFPAIPLNALIKKIKFVNGTFLQLKNADSFTENFEEEFNVNKVINDSLKSINERLDTFYLIKGKLNREETKIFKKVMVNLANDLKDGGISRGLYEYLTVYMIDLTKEDFYHKYHQTLDYLLRLLKREISQRIEESNS